MPLEKLADSARFKSEERQERFQALQTSAQVVLSVPPACAFVPLWGEGELRRGDHPGGGRIFRATRADEGCAGAVAVEVVAGWCHRGGWKLGPCELGRDHPAVTFGGCGLGGCRFRGAPSSHPQPLDGTSHTTPGSAQLLDDSPSSFKVAPTEIPDASRSPPGALQFGDALFDTSWGEEIWEPVSQSAN